MRTTAAGYGLAGLWGWSMDDRTCQACPEWTIEDDLPAEGRCAITGLLTIWDEGAGCVGHQLRAALGKLLDMLSYSPAETRKEDGCAVLLVPLETYDALCELAGVVHG